MQDKVVVITGASGGIGAAAAELLSSRRASVVLVARREDALTEVAARCGANALPIIADMTRREDVRRVVEQAIERFGHVDVWVNNAMASVFSPVKEMKADEYKRVTEVTYLGVVYGTLAALKRMLPRNRGTIVQVGSALV